MSLGERKYLPVPVFPMSCLLCSWVESRIVLRGRYKLAELGRSLPLPSKPLSDVCWWVSNLSLSAIRCDILTSCHSLILISAALVNSTASGQTCLTRHSTENIKCIRKFSLNTSTKLSRTRSLPACYELSGIEKNFIREFQPQALGAEEMPQLPGTPSQLVDLRWYRQNPK